MIISPASDDRPLPFKPDVKKSMPIKEHPKPIELLEPLTYLRGEIDPTVQTLRSLPAYSGPKVEQNSAGDECSGERPLAVEEVDYPTSPHAA